MEGTGRAQRSANTDVGSRSIFVTRRVYMQLVIIPLVTAII